MEDNRTRPVWIIVVFLLLLPAILLVSYLVLVRPMAVMIAVRGAPGSYDVRHFATAALMPRSSFGRLSKWTAAFDRTNGRANLSLRLPGKRTGLG
jgi:hypothetical protein